MKVIKKFRRSHNTLLRGAHSEACPVCKKALKEKPKTKSIVGIFDERVYELRKKRDFTGRTG